MKKKELEKLSPSERLNEALLKKVNDELIGSLKFDSTRQKWRFNYRNDFNTNFKLPTNEISIVVILESPHKEEINVKGVLDDKNNEINSRPLCNINNKFGLCHLLNKSLSNEIFNGLMKFTNKTINVVLMNAL
jgi:hypothetical protein